MSDGRCLIKTGISNHPYLFHLHLLGSSSLTFTTTSTSIAIVVFIFVIHILFYKMSYSSCLICLLSYSFSYAQCPLFHIQLNHVEFLLWTGIPYFIIPSYSIFIFIVHLHCYLKISSVLFFIYFGFRISVFQDAVVLVWGDHSQKICEL